MALNKPPKEGSCRPIHKGDPEFWQQLDQDFPFKGVDEEKLRQQTEQWIICASELLGVPPIRGKKTAKG